MDLVTDWHYNSELQKHPDCGFDFINKIEANT